MDSVPVKQESDPKSPPNCWPASFAPSTGGRSARRADSPAAGKLPRSCGPGAAHACAVHPGVGRAAHCLFSADGSRGRCRKVLEPGSVWAAPGGYPMTVQRRDGKPVIGLNQNPPENSCRASVDVLFRSVALAYGTHTPAVVMTGMGSDGAWKRPLFTTWEEKFTCRTKLLPSFEACRERSSL
jgi:hypothetical protein